VLLCQRMVLVLYQLCLSYHESLSIFLTLLTTFKVHLKMQIEVCNYGDEKVEIFNWLFVTQTGVF